MVYLSSSACLNETSLNSVFAATPGPACPLRETPSLCLPAGEPLTAEKRTQHPLGKLAGGCNPRALHSLFHVSGMLFPQLCRLAGSRAPFRPHLSVTASRTPSLATLLKRHLQCHPQPLFLPDSLSYYIFVYLFNMCLLPQGRDCCLFCSQPFPGAQPRPDP